MGRAQDGRQTRTDKAYYGALTRFRWRIGDTRSSPRWGPHAPWEERSPFGPAPTAGHRSHVPSDANRGTDRDSRFSVDSGARGDHVVDAEQQFDGLGGALDGL
jgi:hypothetical protein